MNQDIKAQIIASVVQAIQQPYDMSCVPYDPDNAYPIIINILLIINSMYILKLFALWISGNIFNLEIFHSISYFTHEKRSCWITMWLIWYFVFFTHRRYEIANPLISLTKM